MNNEQPPLLSFHNYIATLKKQNKEILNIPSFQVQKGSSIGIMGKSGAGKTTFLYSLLGILDQNAFETKGEISCCFDHRCVLLAKLDSEERIEKNSQLFSYIPQEPDVAFNPIMRIGKQLGLLGNRNLKKIEIDSSLKSILKRLSIQEPDRVLNSFAHQLSGGQLQRCFIAGALYKDAKILLADEPVSSLDALTAKEIVDIFNWIKENSDKTLIVVSHNRWFLNQVCDRTFKLEQGRLVEEIGSRESLRSYVQNKTIIQPEKDMSPILSIQNLFAHYPGPHTVQVLKNVTLDLSKNERLGLVGASGSGKSTLGKILVGLHTHFHGELIIQGHKLTEIARRKRSRMVQLIFQDSYSSLNPRMSIEKAMIEVFKIHRPGFNQGDVTALLESVQIDPQSIKRYPHQFSGGQRQRLVIARALAVRPKLLVCDEIVSNLDPNTTQEIIDLLHQIQIDHDVAILFISHNLKVVRQLCERVIVLKDGEIVEQGNVHDVCESPQHQYTKRLLEAAE